jgi:hypothetical protein
MDRHVERASRRVARRSREQKLNSWKCVGRSRDFGISRRQLRITMHRLPTSAEGAGISPRHETDPLTAETKVCERDICAAAPRSARQDRRPVELSLQKLSAYRSRVAFGQTTAPPTRCLELEEDAEYREDRMGPPEAGCANNCWVLGIAWMAGGHLSPGRSIGLRLHHNSFSCFSSGLRRKPSVRWCLVSSLSMSARNGEAASCRSRPRQWRASARLRISRSLARVMPT